MLGLRGSSRLPERPRGCFAQLTPGILTLILNVLLDAPLATIFARFDLISLQLAVQRTAFDPQYDGRSTLVAIRQP